MADFEVWIRDRAAGTYRGYLQSHFAEDMAPAEVDRRIAGFYASLARDHPDCEAIPMSEPRPPDPAPPAGGVVLMEKRARLAQLRSRGWAALTLAEKDEARTLAFDAGEPSPPAA